MYSFFFLLCYFVMRNHYLNKVHAPTDVCICCRFSMLEDFPRLVIKTDEESLIDAAARVKPMMISLAPKHFSCLNMKNSDKGRKHGSIPSPTLASVSTFRGPCTLMRCSLLQAVKEIVLWGSLFA